MVNYAQYYGGMNLDENKFKELSNSILNAVGDVFVGDQMILRKELCAALANGHVLFEDYPGLGKTLLAKIFARVTGCNWRRIQFTPDLMPADIVGTRVWKGSESGFVLEKGPIFTNILLADEINRSPPKTQSALLEAMEERQVTVEGYTQKLEKPFFVIATQNQIEMEGTFPLPEAQVDRFLLKMSTGYVKTVEMESEILKRRIKWKNDDPIESIEPAIKPSEFIEMQNHVENEIYIDEQVLDYVSKIVRSTREHRAVEVGSSPRGGLALLKLSRAHAALVGRDFVTPDDVKLFAREALCHRIIVKMEYAFEADISPENILEEILSNIEAPKNFNRR
jgi:MoxR-like ATPase